MTNQLEEELRAIQNTITKTREKRDNPHLSDEYYNYLTHQLAELRAEEHTILKKLGVTGDLL